MRRFATDDLNCFDLVDLDVIVRSYGIAELSATGKRELDSEELLRFSCQTVERGAFDYECGSRIAFEKAVLGRKTRAFIEGIQFEVGKPSAGNLFRLSERDAFLVDVHRIGVAETLLVEASEDVFLDLFAIKRGGLAGCEQEWADKGEPRAHGLLSII